MAWELLPTNYTDAVWAGLKRYNQINNEDGTVSFQDVTQYSNKEKSFFGALQANRMNEAMNAIMSMVENGTDLYEAFQIYFDEQKKLFESQTDKSAEEFDEYAEQLKKNFQTDITEFEKLQEQLFETWFQAIKDQLSKDAAGQLKNEIESVAQDMFLQFNGMVNKTTSVNKDENGNTINIVEKADGITATTTFAEPDESTKVITTILTAGDGYKYTKTVQIVKGNDGVSITEKYEKEMI